MSGGGEWLSGCERGLMGAQVSMIMVNGESSLVEPLDKEHLQEQPFCPL